MTRVPGSRISVTTSSGQNHLLNSRNSKTNRSTCRDKPSQQFQRCRSVCRSWRALLSTACRESDRTKLSRGFSNQQNLSRT